MDMPSAPLSEHVDCRGVSDILARVGDKWTVLVVMSLHEQPRRFNDIKRRVGGISQQMLTRTLKMLERDGMLTRNVHATTPPQVEYALTDLGREFLGPVRGLAEWVVANSARMDEARAAYAKRRGLE